MPTSKTTVKRARPAYQYYCNENRPNIQCENPHATFSVINKLLCEKWYTLTDKDKQGYYDLAEEDKERYEREKKEQEKLEGKTSNRNYIQKPRTSYLCFTTDPDVRREYSEQVNGDIRQLMIILGHTWKRMSNEERQPYIDMAEEDKERYKRELDKLKAVEKGKKAVDSDSDSDSDDEPSTPKRESTVCRVDKNMKTKLTDHVKSVVNEDLNDEIKVKETPKKTTKKTTKYKIDIDKCTKVEYFGYEYLTDNVKLFRLLLDGTTNKVGSVDNTSSPPLINLSPAEKNRRINELFNSNTELTKTVQEWKEEYDDAYDKIDILLDRRDTDHETIETYSKLVREYEQMMKISAELMQYDRKTYEMNLNDIVALYERQIDLICDEYDDYIDHCEDKLETDRNEYTKLYKQFDQRESELVGENTELKKENERLQKQIKKLNQRRTTLNKTILDGRKENKFIDEYDLTENIA